MLEETGRARPASPLWPGWGGETFATLPSPQQPRSSPVDSRPTPCPIDAFVRFTGGVNITESLTDDLDGHEAFDTTTVGSGNPASFDGEATKSKQTSGVESRLEQGTAVRPNERTNPAGERLDKKGPHPSRLAGPTRCRRSESAQCL